MQSIESLTAEHRQMEKMADDLLALALERSRKFEATATELFRIFYKHALEEEKNIYKALFSSGRSKDLLEELLFDHKRVFQDIGLQVRRALTSGDEALLVSTARHLQETLKTHFRREERGLFPQFRPAPR
jgi:hypothetical protein